MPTTATRPASFYNPRWRMAAILKIVKLPLSQWKYCWILTKFGVLQHVLNLMRFSKALSINE